MNEDKTKRCISDDLFTSFYDFRGFGFLLTFGFFNSPFLVT